jgi:hypothetical protein
MTAIHSKVTDDEAWDCVICGYFINKPRRWILDYKSNLVSENSIKEECKTT